MMRINQKSDLNDAERDMDYVGSVSENARLDEDSDKSRGHHEGTESTLTQG